MTGLRVSKGLMALLAFGVLPLMAAGCSDDTNPGCQADADCRGDRICVSGVCEDPDDPNPDTPNPDPNPGPTPDVGPNPDPNPEPEPGCFTDIDCPEAAFCDLQTGLCEVGCRAGTCGVGEICDFETRECVGEGCDGDGDCANSEFCNDGQCQEGCRPGGCGEGEVCDLDTRLCALALCEADDDCADDQFCNEEGSCTDGCRSGGCGEGEFCDLDTRECDVLPCDGNGDCNDGQYCDEGTCLDGCFEGSCGEGQSCDLDTRECVCRVDEACDDNEFCDEGQCQDGCRPGGCDEGDVCDLDTRECVERGCEADDECDENQFCDEGVCRAGCREGGCDEGEVCDPDSRECILDLEDGPQVEVSPGEIDFGEVGQSVSVFQELTVRSVGTEPLEIGRVGLEANPSTGFQIIAPQPGTITLDSGETAVYRVRFEPTFLRNGEPTGYNNTVEVDTNDADGRVNVPLSGTGVPNPEQCLRFSDRDINFGFVPVGDFDSAEVELINCGEEALEVEDITIDGSEEFSIFFVGNFPRTLDPGDDLTVRVDFIPQGFEPLQAALFARAGDIEAESIIRSSGADCPDAIARGRVIADEENEFGFGGIRASVGSEVELDGSLSEDPADGDLEYVWTITAPDGSDDLNIEPGLEGEAFTFVPDAPGTYEISLTVTSTLTGIEACEPSNFVVVVPLVSIEMTWDDRSDMDLHLVRSDENGEFSELGTRQDVNPDACYFANTNPDWGVEDVAGDNPIYLVDDTNGFGPETILMGGLEEDRRYQINGRLAQRRSFESGTLTFVITSGDEVVTLEGEVTDQGDIFVPAIILGDGTIVPTEQEP